MLNIQGDPKKNRTHKNFIKSYKGPANFLKFAELKLQSVYYHSAKFQLPWSLCIKVMFFPKYAPNGLCGCAFFHVCLHKFFALFGSGKDTNEDLV